MQTFPITCFKYETHYPESSVRIQLGRSWTFTAPPDAPDQRIFVLTLSGMKYYIDDDGDLDLTTNASINNLGVLEAFYQSVRTWDKFHLVHPIYGTLVVQFNKPLVIARGTTAGLGVVDDITVELLEIP